MLRNDGCESQNRKKPIHDQKEKSKNLLKLREGQNLGSFLALTNCPILSAEIPTSLHETRCTSGNIFEQNKMLLSQSFT